MKHLLNLSVLVTLAFFASNSWGVQTPETSTQEIDHEQTINVVLKERLHPFAPPDYHCRIIGDPVRLGTRVRFNFKISNSGSENCVFDRIETGCGCLLMKCEKNVIPANGVEVVSAVAEYFVQRSHTGEQYGFNIELMLGKKSNCSIHFTGPLEGVLSIPQVRAMESTGDFSEWRIPIVATRPVDLNRLQVQLSDSLKDLVARVEVVDGKSAVVVSGPTVSLGLAGIIGDVKVRDPVLELQAATRVSFLKRPAIRISPLIIRLVKKPDGECYSANVLIQAIDQRVEAGSEQVKNLIQSIECRANIHELQVSKTRINDQLYRVMLTFSPADGQILDESEFSIEWKVVSLLGVSEVASTGSILK